MLVLSKNSICEYEKGRSEPNIETLVKLSEIFDCSVDYLVGKTDEFSAEQTSPLSNEESLALSSYKKLPDDMKNLVLSTLNLLAKYQKNSR